MKIILLILLSMNIINAELLRNNNIVKDTVSGLEWQDDAIGEKMLWKSAIDHCENLTLNGSEWRLPNINELKSIVDRSRIEPAIFEAFENTNVSNTQDYYWSSTSTSTGSAAILIDFGYGSSSSLHKGTSGFVRCVRNTQ